ncbi:hypothetical protein LSH36_880g00006, partial [Paralvinella palmiformis]
IRDEWSFDEAVNIYFGCDVYSFDPSLNKRDHVHRQPNMYFYNLGIWGSNRVIDYLKVDAEGAELPLITHLIKSDVRKQIKQEALELHTPRLNVERQPMTVTDCAEIYFG